MRIACLAAGGVARYDSRCPLKRTRKSHRARSRERIPHSHDRETGGDIVTDFSVKLPSILRSLWWLFECGAIGAMPNQKAVGLAGDDVGRILAFVADRIIAIPLHRSIEILWKVSGVKALGNELRVASERWIDICNIDIVSGLSSQERSSRGTAKCHSTVVAVVGCSFLDKVLLKVRHVQEGVHVQVLVVGEDEDHIRLLIGAFGHAGGHQRMLLMFYSQDRQ
ncbi:hypothetical protein KC347_g263 [Hortaea werneckii]|nr:hypothetical protein KC347_g263 [Hortaea werneckii]